MIILALKFIFSKCESLLHAWFIISRCKITPTHHFNHLSAFFRLIFRGKLMTNIMGFHLWLRRRASAYTPTATSAAGFFTATSAVTVSPRLSSQAFSTFLDFTAVPKWFSREDFCLDFLQFFLVCYILQFQARRGGRFGNSHDVIPARLWLLLNYTSLY